MTTSPLSAEFRQKYAFYELALVTRGSVYVYEEHHSYPPLNEYGGGLKDLDHQVRENPDGSLTYTFKVPPQYLEVANGTLFDVVMSYYPLDENEPEPSSRSNVCMPAPILIRFRRRSDPWDLHLQPIRYR